MTYPHSYTHVDKLSVVYPKKQDIYLEISPYSQVPLCLLKNIRIRGTHNAT